MSYFKYVLAAAALILFLFLRLYKLPESLLFYNDMGRDFIVLLNWSETGKPPLLGPQTSVLSYNQTAWYFYVLYPFFILSAHSAYSSVYSLLFTTTFLFLLTLYVSRKSQTLTTVVLLSFTLLSIHPQIIAQNKFIWNPSFLPIFLLTATVAFISQFFQYNRYTTVLQIVLLAFACGFSYSAVPFAAILFFYTLFRHRQKWSEILLIGFAAAALVFLPTIAFEIRHSFTLTKLAFIGQTTPQAHLSVPEKFQLLTEYLFPAPNGWSVSLFLVFCLCMIFGVYYYFKKRSGERAKQFLFLAVTLITLLILTFTLPITLEKHYIFPLLTLVILITAYLPRKLNLVLLLFFGLVWLQPDVTKTYLSKPIRSIPEMEECYKRYCAAWQEPSYVSMESGILVGYHNAPDHQFFLREAGCKILDIEKTQDQASYMIVIGDNANYTHGQSAYHELTLFGPAEQTDEYSCTDNLKLYRIKKQ